MGLNVTAPWKAVARRVAASVSPLVSALQVANTLIRTDAGWHAENTDVEGFATAYAPSLDAVGADLIGVLGTGGAALAVCAALAKRASGQVLVRGRSVATERTFLATLRAQYPQTSWEHWSEATPVRLGVIALPPAVVVPDDVRVSEWIDVCYGPAARQRQLRARARNIRVSDGERMVEEQARLSFGLFVSALT